MVKKLSVSSKSLTKPYCERCGRPIDQGVLACPEQASGQCPYVIQSLVPIKERLGGAFFTLVSVIILTMWVIKGLRPRGCELVQLLAGIAFIGVGVYATLRRRILVYDPHSKVKWKQETLLGIPLKRTLFADTEPVLDDLAFSQPLTLPPSVLALPDTPEHWRRVKMEQAVVIFRAALIGLVAHNAIRARRYHVYTVRWNGTLKRKEDTCLFSANRGQDRSSINGALETKIISELTQRMESEEDFEWPDGVPVYDLVRSIYQKDVSSPPSWLIELVTKDAATHRWARFRGIRPLKRLEPDPSCTDQFSAEWAAVSALLLRLIKEQPDLSRILNHQIERAIKSRRKPWIQASAGFGV
jgi:hypothetical protein